ncbi:MAG: 16S rRNA (uracil(1498)-N(3))-methyltransferase [Ponticaulis sp.]|nr:16S rRNA (uracil(1498)-N(3))-methyltransferase [Ponticaulis sp.]
MSTRPRLFVPTDLMAGSPVALDENQSKYLFRVMRLDVGDEVRVFNGRHGEWLARVDQILGKSAGLLKVDECLREQRKLTDLHLLFAPLKKTRTDFVVEKATELGVEVIQPVITQYTQSERVRVDRLTNIVMEAAEQTERLNIPRVQQPLHLIRALEALPSDRRVYFCDERGDDEAAEWGGELNRARPMIDVLQDHGKGSAAILIGPEGGFSPQERDVLRKTEGIYPVSLGPRILRAETAAVAALTLYQAICDDWRAVEDGTGLDE